MMSGRPPSGEILFIAHRVPYPPDRGDKIRSYHELRRLARHAPVHLAALADDPRDLEHDEVLAGLTASHCVVPRARRAVGEAAAALLKGEPLSVALFRNARLRGYVRRVMDTRPVAAVFIYSGQMASYVGALPARTRLVLDFCDADSQKFAAYGRSAAWPMAWVYRREGRLLGRFERDASLRADASLFISDAEADLFASFAGDDAAARVKVVENGVDLDYFDPALALPVPRELAGLEGSLLLFTGQMDYRPNVDAVTAFADEVLPSIRQRHREARFVIVGRRPTPQVLALGKREGVIVTGEVPDVRGYLAAADVVVAPLRIARGIQNKVLEAMAMARPVVASAEAAQGIDALDRRDLMVAHRPEQEIELTLRLLDEPGHAAQIGRSARQRMEERYSWDATLSRLAPIVLGHEV